MMMTPGRNWKKREGLKGAALVEFALVVPLLVLLVFGIIEFSVFFYDRAMLTNASREAARAGVLFRESSLTPRLTQADLAGIVDAYCASRLINFGGPSAITTTATPDPQTLGHGDHLTVSVSYHYDFLVMPGFLSDLVGGVELGAVTVMRAE